MEGWPRRRLKNCSDSSIDKRGLAALHIVDTIGCLYFGRCVDDKGNSWWLSSAGGRKVKSKRLLSDCPGCLWLLRNSRSLFDIAAAAARMVLHLLLLLLLQQQHTLTWGHYLSFTASQGIQSEEMLLLRCFSSEQEGLVTSRGLELSVGRPFVRSTTFCVCHLHSSHCCTAAAAIKAI